MARVFVLVDCCPCDHRLAEVLLRIKSKTGCSYESIYRGSAPAAQRFLSGRAPCYKHNQAWIYANYPPGTANRPGTSSHEECSDGVAYVGPVGRRLFWWQCGIDVDDAHVEDFIREAAREGFTATITYPHSKVEYHHVNFRKQPVIPRPWRPLKRGSSGPRVRYITRILSQVDSPHTGKPYLPYTYKRYTPVVERAVRQFQVDHRQKPDGIYGIQTARQLAATWRWWKKHKKR